jgi:NitT/TauT family transport system substrate-binding protein
MPASLSRARTLGLLTAAPAARASRVFAQPVTVRCASSTQADSYFQATYAAEAGFFQRAGLNVEITNFSNAGAIAAALAGGAVDVAFNDPIAVANAYAHGIEWAFFAGGGLYATDAPTTVLCAPRDSTIRTGKDLEGKAVAVIALNSISTLGVQSWVESTGGDISKVKLFQAAFATMLPAINRGDVAAALMSEPVLSQVKNDVRVVAKAFDAIGTSFFICAGVSTRAWINQNRATARRFAQAVAETTRWANTHHDDSALILSKEARIPIDVVHNMTRVRFADLDPRLVQPVLDAAYRYHVLEKAVKASDIVAAAS